MNAALERARRGALLLGCVVVFSILSFHLWFEKSLLESTYWTVITIAGVGYSQSVDQEIGDARQFLSIVVIFFGMMAMAYTVGMLIQAIVEGQLDKVLGDKRMTKVIDKLKGHVIICGFGRIGQNLSHRLARHRVPFVVIDPCVESIAEAKSHEFLFLEGDATDEAVLQSAGIERAATLVIALQNDSNNVFLTLTARNMNPELRIIARGEHPRTEKKLFQAGAACGNRSRTGSRHDCPTRGVRLATLRGTRIGAQRRTGRIYFHCGECLRWQDGPRSRREVPTDDRGGTPNRWRNGFQSPR